MNRCASESEPGWTKPAPRAGRFRVMSVRPDRAVLFVWLGLLLLVLPTTLAEDAPPGDPTPPEILVSRQLLESERLTIGTTILLSVSADGSDPQRFLVVGSYEPVPDPMQLGRVRHEVRLHLDDLTSLVDPVDLVDADGAPGVTETVDALQVRLADTDDAEAYARAVADSAPGLLAYPTRGADSADPFVVLERFHLAIAWVTVAGSTAFLLALMVMRADERRETVGVLRLIGFTRQRVLVEVFVEGLLIAAAGALFGTALAWLSQGLFNRFFQWHYDTALVFVRVTSGIVWRCIVWTVPLGVLAGLLASWGLLRREVMELLRR